VDDEAESGLVGYLDPMTVVQKASAAGRSAADSARWEMPWIGGGFIGADDWPGRPRDR
jgi:hypothetical protein